MLIRYFGAAKAASGVEEETLDLSGATLQSLLELLAGRHPTASAGAPPLKSVISRSTFLVNGFAARDRSVPLQPQDTVDILPPFAGG
ncbi:MoaD/ThiS family protein [Arthrobacter jiangjiafuii]|uniref:MoaD/ThiS family protein n=1 Tax=Arthrobacter jiangjiafuii TaxID=2817475 RepID=A0A975R0M8_9MICC|nr:MoaD/ThiS family protein [Arthrobacter jiangjiafuii]MBP3044112.1 MoaD/ThiS family protein [Arthrobacter jiangjiafuii]QWC11090.1 MoaD/ThiS family protein [Arthrobacter jiangjiafuii]